jgi:hypothetical protein
LETVKADKAAGELYLACSVEQRMHIDAVQDDPVKIWTTLASIHLQQHPGARFNVWDDFFSIRKQPDESLSTLIARIEDGMSKIKELRPTGGKTAYTIQDLDAELICMTMVHSLGEEYSHFGYKGWKFYNPTTKKTVIAERADFDERYFPLSKRPSVPSIAPPSLAVENTPAVTTKLPSSAPAENTPAAAAPRRPRTLPAAPKPARKSYYVPPHSDDSDSDDEPSSDESLDHGGDIGPPALPAVVPVVPAPAPVSASPPPHSPSPVAPPRPPSPIGIGARMPRRTRMKPREWWKLSNAQLDDEVDDDIEDAEMGYEIALSTVSNAEPLSYAEALRRPDAEQWKHAALEELNAHSTNGTWKLVPRPAGKKVIGSKWVFKVKRNADGSIEHYKGRAVAKGYNQRPGFDYIEIFAPTVRMPTIRVVLAISALHDYHLRSIDISHAYLNGEMDCDVYMEQPEGFAVCEMLGLGR